MKKIQIELRPYDALAILAFMKEYINDDNRNDQRFSAIHETLDAYQETITKSITMDQIEDARLECHVNDIAGRHPSKK